MTLLGPGGIGKTRLALAAADALRTDFADGVNFVALADVRDAAQVFHGVAAALGATVAGGTAALDDVKAHLQDKEALLVLDNVEQVVDAAADVAELLQSAPRLKVLVTVRVALRVTAERIQAVEPLGLPTGSVIGGAAVDLCLQRMRAVRPDIDLDDAGGPTSGGAPCRGGRRHLGGRRGPSLPA